MTGVFGSGVFRSYHLHILYLARAAQVTASYFHHHLTISSLSLMPAQFIPLPALPDGTVWPQDIQKAHETLAEAYTRAATVVETGSDPDHLQHHVSYLDETVRPLLKALAQKTAAEG